MTGKNDNGRKRKPPSGGGARVSPAPPVGASRYLSGAKIDISLIIELSGNDPRLVREIESLSREKLRFLRDRYWEATDGDVGLHVTLFEFATYEGDGDLARASAEFEGLAAGLSDGFGAWPRPRLVLRGWEPFPSSVALRAEAPAGFLDRIESLCRTRCAASPYFNIGGMPSPLHCTIARFAEPLSEPERLEIAALRHRAGNAKVAETRVGAVSLLLTSEMPYRGIVKRARFPLETRPPPGR